MYGRELPGSRLFGDSSVEAENERWDLKILSRPSIMPNRDATTLQAGKLSKKMTSGSGGCSIELKAVCQ
jgi:hypothetical protein